MSDESDFQKATTKDAEVVVNFVWACALTVMALFASIAAAMIWGK